MYALKKLFLPILILACSGFIQIYSKELVSRYPRAVPSLTEEQVKCFNVELAQPN